MARKKSKRSNELDADLPPQHAHLQGHISLPMGDGPDVLGRG